MKKYTLDAIPDDSVDDVVMIDRMSITYCQPADTCSDSDEVQFLTIETARAGCGVDDVYYNIEIDKKWSVESEDDIVALVRDFERRLRDNTIRENEIKRRSDEK